jgi:hypothetical protein
LNTRVANTQISLSVFPPQGRGDRGAFVHRLRESGIPETQAEAIAEAFRDASGEAELATKDDIKLAVAELRTELDKEVRDLKVDLITWMTGALIAQAAVIATLVKLL